MSDDQEPTSYANINRDITPMTPEERHRAKERSQLNNTSRIDNVLTFPAISEVDKQFLELEKQ